MQVFYSLRRCFSLESPLSAFAKSLVGLWGTSVVSPGQWQGAAGGTCGQPVALVPSGSAAQPGSSPAPSCVFCGLQGKWELEEFCCRRDCSTEMWNLYVYREQSRGKSITSTAGLVLFAEQDNSCFMEVKTGSAWMISGKFQL